MLALRVTSSEVSVKIAIRFLPKTRIRRVITAEVPSAMAVLTGSLLHTVHAMCAHILSGVGSHGSSEREIRHHRKTIHTHDDDIGCDDHLAETVRQRLYDNHGHGKDGLGDAGGESQPDDLQCIFLFHLQMAELKSKISVIRSSFQKQRIADTACAMTVA